MPNIAHYPGVVAEVIEAGQIFGPDTAGALYRAVEATYDDEHDVTTLRFRPIAPGDIATLPEGELYRVQKMIEAAKG